MKLSDYAIIGIAIISISVLAWGWRQEGIKRALAEQEILVTQAVIKDSARALDSLRSQLGEERSQFGKDTLRLVSLIAQQRSIISGLRSRGDSLETVLVLDTTSSDSITTLIQLSATRLQEARTCGVALDSTQVLFVGCRSILAQTDTVLAKERSLRLAQERLTEQYRRLSHPSVWDRAMKGLPWLAAGVVIGVVLQ